jgi:ribonuclease VapC
MVLDASAIIAMLGDEAEGDRFAAALESAQTRAVPPVAVWEAVAGLARLYPLSIPEARRKVADFLEAAKVETLVIGQRELDLAIDAYDQFGKGGHPARLNLGDCFAYAAAKAAEAPLLHKDEGHNRRREPASSAGMIARLRAIGKDLSGKQL